MLSVKRSGISRFAFAAVVACALLAQQNAIAQSASIPRAPAALCVEGEPCDSPVPTSGQYPWYPALDVGTLPFAQAGAWGAGLPLQIAAAPVTTRTVNAATPDEVRNASFTPGTRIVLTANMGSIGIGGQGVALTDLEIIIPAGISTGRINIGGNINRVRIGGPTRGRHSGGYVAALDLNGAGASNVFDVVVDGLDIGSTLEPFGYSIINSDTFTRFAITNNRLRSVAASTLLQGRHLVIAGNSIQSSAYTWGQLGGQGTGWSLRLGSAGPVVIVGNDIRGRRYHRIRLGTGDTNQSELLVYVARNTLLDESESSIMGIGILTGNTPARAAWFVNNDVYAYGGGARLDVSRSLYGRVTGNRIYSSSITPSFLSGQAAEHRSFLPNADVDYSTGNTFSAWRRPAAWGGAGDATQVFLAPAAVVNQALEDQERAIPRGP